MSRYSCSLRGECEKDDEYAEFSTLTDCKLACKGRQQVEVWFQIYQYDLNSALEQLSPTDTVEFVWENVGLSNSS